MIAQRVEPAWSAYSDQRNGDDERLGADDEPWDDGDLELDRAEDAMLTQFGWNREL